MAKDVVGMQVALYLKRSKPVVWPKDLHSVSPNCNVPDPLLLVFHFEDVRAVGGQGLNNVQES